MGKPRRAVPCRKLTTSMDLILWDEMNEEIRLVSPTPRFGEVQQFLAAAIRRQIDHLRATRVAECGQAEAARRLAAADQMYKQSKKRSARLRKVLGSLERYIAEERRSLTNYEG